AAASAPIAQAFPIVRRALKILADREVSPQTGLLKSTLLQLDSTFSERNYGASSFLDFAEKLAQAGLVQLKHAGRSVMVELNDGFEDGEKAEPKGDAATADVKVRTTTDEDGATDVVQAFRPADGRHGQDQRPPIEATGSPAEGVRLVGQILRNATGARWPMYLRNVKQILRAADASFDERRYGFGGLMDLLRACQKEGLIRLERDRRGGLRVFQGAALQRAPAPAAIVDVAPTDVVEIQPGDAVDGDERAAAEPSAVEP